MVVQTRNPTVAEEFDSRPFAVMATNNLKVTCVSGEGIRLVDGRQPDVIVNIRLLSKKNSSSVSLPRPTCLI